MKTSTRRNLLKSVHILFSAIWLGSVFSMMLLSTVKNIDADKTLQVLFLIKLIDAFVAVSAILTLISGLLIAWLAGWGFQTTWVKIKIYANVGIILLGWLAVLQWEGVIAILHVQEGSNLQNANYLYEVLHFNSLAVLLLIAVFIISVFKPWSKKVDKTLINN